MVPHLKKLSDAQKKIVTQGDGLFVVRAAAGSGKTYTVASRIAGMLSSWKHGGQGIAVMSFTNVAWKEIAITLEDEFGVSDIGFPHYLGTIDSFLNRFLFLPFGHKVMNCSERPKLVGEPHSEWKGRSYIESFFDRVGLDRSGNCYYLSNQNRPKGTLDTQIFKKKLELLKSGFATQTDANYFSLLLLRKFPWLAKSLAQKFPVVILDEAQDTSDIQMEILDILISAGLEQVMLVGDPDQAIYEWRNSDPSLFIERCERWKERSYVLAESRRSSQLICNFAFKLSSLGQIPEAVNPEVKSCNIEPDIVVYEKNKIREIADEFIDRCIKYGVSPESNKVAIISRSASIYDDILGAKDDAIEWTTESFLADICSAKVEFDRGAFQKSVKLASRLYLRKKTGSDCLSKDQIELAIQQLGRVGFYLGVMNSLKSLPPFVGTVASWCESARATLEGSFGVDVNYKKKYREFEIEKVVVSPKREPIYRGCHISTVHKVKGTTYDAVLVVLKSRGIGKSYVKLIESNTKLSESEELRSIYVAITRPRKVLVMAVPDEKNLKAWRTIF